MRNDVTNERHNPIETERLKKEREGGGGWRSGPQHKHKRLVVLKFETEMACEIRGNSRNRGGGEN